ncbi:hypothetical protein BU23DRAFT_599275 [Bimuria novae-zelandiae CBS 107.79]|uniref:Uncharacterized protein n=1 Tax=Bimuria novae-zelandiae CBS 107.79 TaxID=1447943 RepID=A0A6A5VID9_9PLEO|nr:hypothetical protein BU23DRAFT_599275 [Bimuria novae-zelandiae CBS 107.79]
MYSAKISCRVLPKMQRGDTAHASASARSQSLEQTPNALLQHSPQHLSARVSLNVIVSIGTAFEGGARPVLCEQRILLLHSPHLSAPPAADSQLPLSIHHVARPPFLSHFDRGQPPNPPTLRDSTSIAMTKQTNRYRARSVEKNTPYNRTLQQPGWASYSDADVLELPDPPRAVDFHQESTAGEGTPAQAAEPWTSTTTAYMPNLRSLTNICAVEGEADDDRQDSLDCIGKAQVVGRAQELLSKCNQYQQNFITAIQHFDTHNQLFTSSCDSDRAGPDRLADILATYQAVKRAGEELHTPQFAYIVTLTEYRLFLANLLERLPPKTATRVKLTRLFNELSCNYEGRENAIRETMQGMYRNLADRGGEGKKIEVFMKAFKQRAELLKWQQNTLDAWVKEALQELPEGYVMKM